MREHGNNEFERLLLSQHENVIPVYATTTTDRNSLIIVLDRAKNGDLKSFYNSMLDKHNYHRKTKFKWHGIVSILPWDVLSAADRMLLVFQLSSALKKVHAQMLLHRDLKPENVMVDGDGNVKLADFGGTKDQASIDAGGNQTGVFTWGWADF